VNVKETFSEVPDEITMLLLSINSGHMAGWVLLYSLCFIYDLYSKNYEYQ
jgi:hypothetical protein